MPQAVHGCIKGFECFSIDLFGTGWDPESCLRPPDLPAFTAIDPKAPSCVSLAIRVATPKCMSRVLSTKTCRQRIYVCTKVDVVVSIKRNYEFLLLVK